MKKKILIQDENQTQIEEKIDAVQNRAIERKADWSTVCEAEKQAKKMEEKLLKKHMKGLQYLYTLQENMPNSYKYKYQATAILLEYTPKGWVFVSASRDAFFPGQKDLSGFKWNLKEEEKKVREEEVKQHLYNNLFK